MYISNCYYMLHLEDIADYVPVLQANFPCTPDPRIGRVQARCYGVALQPVSVFCNLYTSRNKSAELTVAELEDQYLLIRSLPALRRLFLGTPAERYRTNFN